MHGRPLFSFPDWAFLVYVLPKIDSDTDTLVTEPRTGEWIDRAAWRGTGIIHVADAACRFSPVVVCVWVMRLFADLTLCGLP